MWQPTRIEFSSGWWVDVDLLRHTMLTAESIAAYVHLDTAAFIDDLAVWAEGVGLPYGVEVNRQAQTFTAIGPT